jgi:hypothetical protein
MSGNAAARYNIYDDTDRMHYAVNNGHHRAVIGGMWEELGTLQTEFLKARGLQPNHALIDIGAGSFRAGVKLVPYLDPGNYYAIDLQASLLEAGYMREILPAGLGHRFPLQNFAATGTFDISGFGRQFDFGIAQSVFSHLPIALLGNCLAAAAPHLRGGGQLFVTMFFAPENAADKPFTQMPGGFVTAPDHDPFHTTLGALGRVASLATGWQLSMIGNWGHPFNQQMTCFTRLE